LHFIHAQGNLLKIKYINKGVTVVEASSGIKELRLDLRLRATSDFHVAYEQIQCKSHHKCQ
jgi:hypothetical protein